MDHIEFVYTFGMEEEDVEERLRTEEAGVLSLTNDRRAYGVPVHFHYDGESLYFRLSDDRGDSKKLAFAETTEEASFVLFGIEEPDSWSVVVTGPLRRLTAEERERFDATEINEDFGPVRVFDESIDDVEVDVFEMEMETVTGRETSEYYQ